MPTLNWIRKGAVANHPLEVPFRLAQDVPDIACGDPGVGNLTNATLEWRSAYASPKIVYAAGCRFGEGRMEREDVTFQPTPHTVQT
jgi:hypothetical protein